MAQNPKPIFYELPPATTRSTFPFFYASTSNSCITILVWRDVTDKLTENIKPKIKNQGEHPTFLFIDRHSAHMDPETVPKLLEINIQDFFFPTNSTHFLQLLDYVPFATFKKQDREI